ncbi:MAG: hydroxymethylglutaryl-CoA synthase family protein [bacterium]
MEDRRIGIGDISVYIPAPEIHLDELLEHRVRQRPDLERRLRRAVESTGQISIRYPELWEDAATLSAEAVRTLVDQGNDLRGTRYLAVGTETGVDHSKPIAAYVQGMMHQSDASIPGSVSTFQVQHACAGGTIAMLSVGALLQAAGRDNEQGLVICSDIARYDVPSTAEITQGAGSVGLLIEGNPRLLELDITTQGYASQDVDDFFRPLGSTTAKVKGGYSVQCYNEALEAAFDDHATRLEMDPKELLLSTDLFVLHVPFYRMALTALHRLIHKYTGYDAAAIDAMLVERGFDASLQPIRRIGNIYSGSAYMALYFLLEQQYRKHGSDIVGKRLMLGSYGSGNTMIVLSARVADGAPEVIRKWNVDRVLNGGRHADLPTYEQFIEAPLRPDEYAKRLDVNAIPAGSFYLSGVREDGYREYVYKR